MGGRRDRRVEPRAVHCQLGIHDALEAARHVVGGVAAALPVFIPRRQAAGQFPLASSFHPAAGRRQARGQHEVRVGVERVAPHRLLQPVNRALRVMLEPVRVAEVEGDVRLVAVEFDRLREVVRGAAGLRCGPRAQLHDAEVVERRRARLLVRQPLEDGERLVGTARRSRHDRAARNLACRLRGEVAGTDFAAASACWWSPFSVWTCQRASHARSRFGCAASAACSSCTPRLGPLVQQALHVRLERRRSPGRASGEIPSDAGSTPPATSANTRFARRRAMTNRSCGAPCSTRSAW